MWKQSSRLGDTSRFDFTLAYTWSFWLLEGGSAVKKSFNPRTKYHLSCSSHTFLQTLAYIQLLQFACCCQGLNFMASKHWASELQIILGNFSQLKNVKFQSLSWSPLDSCIVPDCHPWLRIKSLANSMLESVLTERRRPLPGSLSTLLLTNNTKYAVSTLSLVTQQWFCQQQSLFQFAEF